MSFFEQIAGKSMPKAEEAEVKVDLSGMEKPEALQKLETIVRYCKKSSAASLYVSFPPPRPGGGETLFQPVMRFFKVEKFNGYVSHALPLMTEDKGGVFVVFKL
ncbi:MAG: hypothetical protein HY052_00035 [Proteobacteria bacterium]|nr:hypothetical protein [Pseudomonadota bacterium]